MKLAVFGVIALLGVPVADASAKDFLQQHVINADSACDDPGGNEVNRSVVIKAPDGMFFEKEMIEVYAEPTTRSFSNAAGPSGCFLKDVRPPELVTVETKSGNKVRIPALTKFEVYGHSDCGSGELITAKHVLNNERIRTDCSVKAQINSLDDLK
jgi:hypothetical protein